MSEQDKAHKLANSRFSRRRSKALDIYEWNIQDFHEKETLWKDLLSLSKDTRIWSQASWLLTKTYKDVPDKTSAYKDIQQLTYDRSYQNRYVAAYIIGNVFKDIPEPNLAWEDLKRLVNDSNDKVKYSAILSIGSNFKHISDKENAWEILFKMGNSNKSILRLGAAFTIGLVIQHESFRNPAYSLFQKIIRDEEPAVVTRALVSTLRHPESFPDINLLCNDVKGLANNKNESIRTLSIIVLDSIYRYIPKEKSILDLLYQCSSHEKKKVKSAALDALISNFNIIEDKKKTWIYIHKAVKDRKIKDSTREEIAIFIGESFSKIPCENDVREDILLLTKNKHTKSSIAYSCTKIAESFFEEKNYSKSAEYFNFASKAYSVHTLLGKDSRYYYSESLYNYCKGREKIQILPDILDPYEKTQHLKECIGHFKKATKYAGKDRVLFSNEEFDSINICNSVYSAYYKYNLAFSNMDERYLYEVKQDIENAKCCCSSINTRHSSYSFYSSSLLSKKQINTSTKVKKEEEIVSLLEGLTNTLDECITGKKLENDKEKASIKGKGLGIDSQYKTSINKIKQNVENNFSEIDTLIKDLEAPTFKRIAEHEKNNLKNLVDEENITNILPLNKLEIIKNQFFRFKNTIWGLVKAFSIIVALVVGIHTILSL